MAGLVPAIHVLLCDEEKTWMPATSAGMTRKGRGQASWKRLYRPEMDAFERSEVNRLVAVERLAGASSPPAAVRSSFLGVVDGFAMEWRHKFGGPAHLARLLICIGKADDCLFLV